jgi:hypothetical protein
MKDLMIQSSFLLVIVGAYEWRLRNMAQKISNVPCRDEVGKLVDLKLEVVKYTNQDMRKDMHRLEKKLDLLISKLLDNQQ